MALSIVHNSRVIAFRTRPHKVFTLEIRRVVGTLQREFNDQHDPTYYGGREFKDRWVLGTYTRIKLYVGDVFIYSSKT